MTKEEEAAEAKKKEEEAAAAKKKEGEKGEGKEKVYTETQVKNAMSFVYTQNQELQTKITELEEAAKGKKKEPKKEERSDDDLEVMSRADFKNHILSEMRDSVVKPLSERINKGEQQRASLATEEQVEAAAEKHDDFWEFKDEIRALAKKNPDLDIDSLYALAKHQSPDKVAALDKKANAKKEEDDKKKKEKHVAKTFGGLLPTSGVTKRNTAMDTADAAQAAAESVDLDGHLRALDRE